MKIGIYLPVFGGWFKDAAKEEPETTFDYIKKAALLAEDYGLHSIWVADHLINPVKDEDSPCYEAWTTLSALASLTKNVKLSHITLCQGFRNPALLAKMSSTLQEISNGRFMLSLGACWFKREFEGYGFEWHEHDERISRTHEQLEIIKSLWTEPRTDFQGSFYTISQGILEPKPDPIPEIWYGGESDASKRIVASYADGWLLYPTAPDEVESKIKTISHQLDGRNIKYAASSHVVLGQNDTDAKNRLKEIAGTKSSIGEYIITNGLVGSPETIQEKVSIIEDGGADLLILRFSQTVDELPRFVESVMS
ncbi:MAG: LLM class flavin-dependent oxidoreductase [Candidatus Thorarchaeota archaeon]|jgi:FMNH2-dependent dimethyl sulfone monooxygenase